MLYTGISVCEECVDIIPVWYELPSAFVQWSYTWNAVNFSRACYETKPFSTRVTERHEGTQNQGTESPLLNQNSALKGIRGAIQDDEESW